MKHFILIHFTFCAYVYLFIGVGACAHACLLVCGRQRMNLDAPQELPLSFSKGPSRAWNSPHRQGWSKPKVPPASASAVLGYRCVHYTQLFFTWILGIELTELSHLVSAQKIFQKLISLTSDLWNLLSTIHFFQLRLNI